MGDDACTELLAFQCEKRSRRKPLTAFDVPNLTLAMDCTSNECSDESSVFFIRNSSMSISKPVAVVMPSLLPATAEALPDCRPRNHSAKKLHEDSSNAKVSDRPSTRDVIRATWKTALAITAGLDFISSTVVPFLLVQEGEGEKAFWQEHILSHPTIKAILSSLDQNAVYFGLAFSLCFVIQAFRDAKVKREQALRKRDRARLLHRGDSIRFLDEDDPLNKSGYFQGTGPWVVFCAALFLQLLLLPVGFYALLYQSFQLLTYQDSAGLNHSRDLVTDSIMDATNKENAMRVIINSTSKIVDIPIGHESFATDGNLSVVMLIAKYAGMTIGASLKQKLVKRGWKEGRKFGLQAIIKPRKVWKNVKKAMKWMRWIKYLAPLLAASNKLRENLCELLMKLRQRKDAVVAMKIRRILWKKMTVEERQAKAARGIQSMYRSYQVRRARWALAIFQCHMDELAAIRVQRVLRKILYRARCRIKQKRTELKKLEATEQCAVRTGRRRMTMSPYDRKRLYQLQDEMKTSTSSQSIDRRLLLRPNTRFAVVWKSFFVLCVIIEICELAVNPLLAVQKNNTSGVSPTFSSKLEGWMVPLPVSELKECSCLENERNELNSWILASTRPTRCPSDPWFCSQTFINAQSVYIAVMLFILKHSMAIVACIVFLDVPIHFYTGELCPEMGSVIPKPFLIRWIAPGLMLQLAVNPQMESTSTAAFALVNHALKIGPIRVWRWIDAFFYPTLVVVFDFVERKVWIPLVANINRQSEGEDQEEIYHPASHRRTSTRRATTRASIAYVQRRRSSTNTPTKRSSFTLMSNLSSATSRRFSMASSPRDSRHSENKKQL